MGVAGVPPLSNSRRRYRSDQDDKVREIPRVARSDWRLLIDSRPRFSFGGLRYTATK